MPSATPTPLRKKTPDADQGIEGQDQNTYEEEPIVMNTTSPRIAHTPDNSEPATSRDIALADHGNESAPDPSFVQVPCTQPGCDARVTGHQALEWDPTAVEHRHAGPWNAAPGNITCYFDADLGRWHASVHLSDVNAPLTADEVHAFATAWDAAYAAAQQLNTASAEPCS